VGVASRDEFAVNGFHYYVQLSIDFMVPEPQHFISGRLKCFVTCDIACMSRIEIVLATVNFDNDPATTAFEIHDIGQ
jgi:hypothetical protein